MFSPLCLLITFLVIISLLNFTNAMPGGWTPIDDLSDDNLIANAQFAAGDIGKIIKIQEASKQVVAGLKYDIICNVETSGKCNVYHFQVWDRFGRRTLVLNELLPDSCN
mmetsp:Transcript_3546/g.4887  ORF Transcript_3546/g.4887 Transcript_3546/m.4887 type:complete len:109 (+) Transcript_3546:1662-1988(+)